MKKLHAERLLQVVRVLAELPKEKRFDLHTWHVCGTNACALGWAAADPWFKRRGFKLVLNGSDDRGRLHYIPEYRGSQDYEAAESFFSIGYSDVRRLFSPMEYQPGNQFKSNVIRRIKAFVRDNT